MKELAGLGPSFEGQRLEVIKKRTAVSLGNDFIAELLTNKVYKELFVVCDWLVTPTISSGTPVLHKRGVAHALSNRIEVEIAAGDILKVYKGTSQLVDQMKWLFGEPCPTLYQVNASAFTSAALTGDPTLGTTGQTTIIREAYSIPFENKLTSRYFDTLLNLNGVTTAKLRIALGAASQVADPTDVSSTTWAVTGYITVYASTADHLIDNSFMRWPQSFDDISLGTVQLNGSSIELKPQGELQGFHLRAYKGSNDTLMTQEELRNFEVKIEYGGNFIFKGMLGDFQFVNGCKSSIRSVMPSSAYMNILNNSTPRTGLQTIQGGVFKPLVLTVSTPPSLAGTNIRIVAEYDLIK